MTERPIRCGRTACWPRFAGASRRPAVRAATAAFVVAFLCAGLAACQTGDGGSATAYEPVAPSRNRDRGVQLLGGGGLFGGGDTGGARIGVNALLWRAALDTVSFMPLASADPFGGVVITDWYSDPATPDERFKASVYILDQRLRADALRVSLFRQVRSGANWSDAPVSEGADRRLEDQILTRARQLRIAGVEG